MSNQLVPLGYANTFGDWVVTTNKILAETNDIGANNYIKESGLFSINTIGTGLLVQNDAIVQGVFSVSGATSQASIQNNLTVGGLTYLTNTATSLYTEGTANIRGDLIVAGMVRPTHGNDANGIVFQGGTTGDFANVKYYTTVGDSRRLHLSIKNDPDDDIYLDASGTVVIPNNRDATSIYTGALVIAGGMGVGGDIYVGGTMKVISTAEIQLGGFVNVSNSMLVTGNVDIGKRLTVGGNTVLNGTLTTHGQAFFANTDESTSVTTGSIVTYGGVGVAKQINVNGIVYANNATDSSSPTSGSLIVAGGLGITKKVYIGGASGTDASSVTTGALVVTGGVGISKKLYVGGITNLTDTTDSSSTSTGSLVVSGGVGIAKKVYVGGITNLTDTTDSSSSSTGSLIVSGGAGIAKKVYVGSTAGSTSSSTGALVVAGGVGIAEKLYVGSSITAAGDITAFSDARIKKNVKVIENALQKVEELNGYTYDRTDIDTGRQTGVIAQEVMNVLPEAVSMTADGKYTVAYGNMVGLLIESIKDLNSQVSKLKEEIEKLKNSS